MSSEGVVGELQGRVTSLQERIKLLEGERKALETSQNESNQANETNVAQIRALEKVMLGALQCANRAYTGHHNYEIQW